MTGLILAVALLAALGAASLIGFLAGMRFLRRLDEQHAHVAPFRIHAWQQRNADTVRFAAIPVQRIAVEAAARREAVPA